MNPPGQWNPRPPLFHDNKLQTSGTTITNFNATTPQLKAAKNLYEAYLSLDINNVGPLVSEDFNFQTFPKITNLPGEREGDHFERYGTLFSLMTKIEVDVHELIEAPGKVIVHQSSVLHTIDGDKMGYDSLTILTLVEEGGEFKITGAKDFADPEKRANLHAWAANVLAKRAT